MHMAFKHIKCVMIQENLWYCMMPTACSSHTSRVKPSCLELVVFVHQAPEHSGVTSVQMLLHTSIFSSKGLILVPSRSTFNSDSKLAMRCCCMLMVCSYFSKSILYLCSRFTHADGSSGCTPFSFVSFRSRSNRATSARIAARWCSEACSMETGTSALPSLLGNCNQSVHHILLR